MVQKSSYPVYENMQYRRCGKSGLKLPVLSLGLWHNFGRDDDYAKSRKIILKAFDLGMTHFDLANNYGPPPGEAEITFGKILRKDLAGFRDELVISTKAGYYMWPGPYGEWGSRKYLIASLDQSLKRLGIDYVDIFYHHRPDPDTPLEETMTALDFAVRQGKALYAGISNYNADQTRVAEKILRELGTPCLIHQPRYNIFDRWIEERLLGALKDEGIGCIAFSPLAQGILTDRYLHGVPRDSRAARDFSFLKPRDITEEKLAQVRQLNNIAQRRGQNLAQMGIAWILRHENMTSVVLGASQVSQLEENVDTLKNLTFSHEELAEIEAILAG